MGKFVSSLSQKCFKYCSQSRLLTFSGLVIFLILLTALTALTILAFEIHQSAKLSTMESWLFDIQHSSLAPVRLLVQGHVCDADAQQTLPDVIGSATVVSIPDPPYRLPFVTDKNGKLLFHAAAGSLCSLTLQHPRYHPLTINDVQLTGLHNDTMDLPDIPLIHRRFSLNGFGCACVRVISNSNLPVENASVTLRYGLASYSSEPINNIVTANGLWTVMLPTGHYTACATKSGFTTNCVSVVVLPSRNITFTIVLRYVFVPHVVRFVLEWERMESDLLGKIVGPEVYGSDSPGLLETLASCVTCHANDTCRRITMTLLHQLPGTYRYYVRSAKPVAYPLMYLATSGAEVKVYIDDIRRGTYYVPHRNGTRWNAVEVSGDDLVFINIMSDE